MTGDVVIRAAGLGKKYVIGHQSAERPSTFRDSIVQSARGWGRSARDMIKGAANVAGDEIEEFWALKDLNFEINRGDVVGIIGRNGAGKSTLLKVLSRITEPSEGRVEIKGRIASLLEVGTGFHPELSGRENIYLNGAILGMSRDEIKRKFDEIVDFAEIEKFLDTPVKRYSSGMYVRLAFAVAAHLEPEILIVDEVLAVGDAEFQKKCLGKMKDVAGHGRTVLFVSHNTQAISNLCSEGIVLEGGSVALKGNVDKALAHYASATRRLLEEGGTQTLVTDGGQATVTVEYDQNQKTLKVIVDLSSPHGISPLDLHLFLDTSTQMRASLIDLRREAARYLATSQFESSFSVYVPLHSLSSDIYTLGFHWHQRAFTLTHFALYQVPVEHKEFALYPIQYQGPALLQKRGD